MRANPYDYRWRLAAKAVLRDEPLCRHCVGLVGTVRAACSAHADHILPVHAFPKLRLERSNLQGLCVPCHTAKTAADVHRVYSPEIGLQASYVVVFGLPGAGKTTYASEHHQRHGSWVWDADKAAKQLGVAANHPAVQDRLSAFVELVAQDDHPFIIIQTEIDAAWGIARAASAAVVHIDTHPVLCQARIALRDSGEERDRRLRQIIGRRGPCDPAEGFDHPNPGAFE